MLYRQTMSVFRRSFMLLLVASMLELSLCNIENKINDDLEPTDGGRLHESSDLPCVSKMVERMRSEEEPIEWKQSGPVNCPKPCGPCRPKRCNLPNCKCSNSIIPGRLSRDETPQMVIVTMQSAVNNLTYTGFLSLFEDLKNPNGCSATGTFFASHVYTDHFYVQSLQSKGHEIGDNTVTSTLNPVTYWRNAAEATWENEIRDQASILKKFANVTNVRGFRAPYLQMGGDNQLSAMKDIGVPLLYDASRASVKFSKSSEGGLLWPYSYDNESTQDCVQSPCPRRCYPGIWQIPMLAFWDNANASCAILDACSAKTYNDIFRLLYDRFVDHYSSNRAPFLISMNPGFLTDEFKVKGLKLFLQYLTSYKKVYFVSAERALDWIRNPTPFSKLDDFEPWKCVKPNPPVCPESTAAVRCRYDDQRHQTTSSSFAYTLRSCAITGPQGCPRCYPWVNDAEGKLC